MSPIIASADIGRPAEDVYAYATDPARLPENVATLKQRLEQAPPGN